MAEISTQINRLEHDYPSCVKSNYVLREMLDVLNGSNYITIDMLYDACRKHGYPSLDYNAYYEDLNIMIHAGFICREGKRLYIPNSLHYENHSAERLGELLTAQPFAPVNLASDAYTVDGITLCDEQKAAVNLALSNHISLIMGGAGSGKSTLVRAIYKNKNWTGGSILAAPTGKASQVLREKTGLPVSTVHSALGIGEVESSLRNSIWENIGFVLIDEASMVSAEMFDALMEKVSENCRIVLMGDPQQLPAVGAGNILADLIHLNIPRLTLKENHRQSPNCVALTYNVMNFNKIFSGEKLKYDSSFQFKECTESKALESIAHDLADLLKAGKTVQVLSPYRRKNRLSTQILNQTLRDKINPAAPDKLELSAFRGPTYRDGDRVVIMKNDKGRNCYNGDIGVFHVIDAVDSPYSFEVDLGNGRCPRWKNASDLLNLELAYATTVHKSQGSGATRS